MRPPRMATAPNPPSSSTRRSHRKSRNGCLQCKQRHMKCDEHRPICVNCSTSGRLCVFSRPALHVVQDRAGHGPSSDSRPSSATAASPASIGSSPRSLGAVIGSTRLDPSSHIPESQAESLPPQLYDLTHLELLHHLETQILRHEAHSLFPDDIDPSCLVDEVIQSAMSAPYLMDELLAFSALHLSVVTPDPSKKKDYHHRASQLQTRALTIFNTERPVVSEKNCMEMLLFSGTLGLHALFDTATFHQDFTEFLEMFIQFLSLHRGICTVTRQTWDIISKSKLRNVVSCMTEVERQDPQFAESPTECDTLLAKIEAARNSFDLATFRACHEAVGWLQWVTRQRRCLKLPLRIHAVMAWPVLISFEYLQALRQRRPEALVILAHWAVFLHYHREFWVFGDSGRVLIESTTKYLGSYWEDWMAWPNLAIEGSS
ncbi:hypothetical protein TWF481_006473 [Arthrobotrys musiformis]|uniref:Zn(2)-C6 fungal-type domain-containing protein n=1 Tax=Arthrobotrys musiformis TaxID=47236 RepID=A0AAV9W8L0_9PEZI